VGQGKWVRILGVAALVMTAAALSPEGAATPTLALDAKAQPLIEKAFPNSNKCKRCHERVFENGKRRRSPALFTLPRFERLWMPT